MTRRVLFVGVVVGGFGIFGAAHAAIPALPAEELQAQATDIVLGEVIAVFSRLVDQEGELTNREIVAEVRVSCLEKGEGAEAGEVIYVRTWTPESRPPGWAGHQGGPMPTEGTYVRLYLRGAGDGTWQILTPNGLNELEVQPAPDGTVTLTCTPE